jgi:predicted peroxiredoxin
MKLTGNGAILNSSTGVEFPFYADIILDLEQLPPQDADIINQTITGTATWENFDLNLFGIIMGVSEVKRVRMEDVKIPDPAPYVVTLAKENPIALTEVIRDSVQGDRFHRDEKESSYHYVINGGEITFDASDAGKKLVIDYCYGKCSNINSSDLPGNFKLIGCLHLNPTTTDGESSDMVVIADRCVRTTVIEKNSFEFAICNRNPGDMKIYFS